MLDIIDGWRRGECNGTEMLLYKNSALTHLRGIFSEAAAVAAAALHFSLVSKKYKC